MSHDGTDSPQIRAAGVADAAELARLSAQLGYPCDAATMRQRLERLAVAGHARLDAFVISLGSVLEGNAVRAQRIHCGVDIRARQRDVLDALTVVRAQVLLDLTFVILRFVDRNADLAARARHGA
jgi:hypothetical protein